MDCKVFFYVCNKLFDEKYLINVKVILKILNLGILYKYYR